MVNVARAVIDHWYSTGLKRPHARDEGRRASFMSRGRTMKGVARWASLIGALVSSRPGAAGPLTVQQVRNARACLPSLADPPDRLIQFADGRYSSADVPFADMRTA